MAKSTGGPTRVLIVDDNEDFARVLGALLGLSGSEVRVAFNADAALDVAPTFAPHVAIIDLMLPGMNGFALAGRLRQLSPGTPLVAMTGLSFPEEEARAAGFDELLRKPVTVADVRAVVAKRRPLVV